MTNYYVYYRVDPARLGFLRPEIEKLFEKVQQHSGVRGRWTTEKRYRTDRSKR